ncbi:MAG: cyclic nucleotide-binding domain-containing protein [Chloroflexi bacterium]|nr:cyclic nucleotide-binding domain-containing protein [Chloroflexota bacterium]
MQIRFWGTRGSIASPGPSTVQYGGNTSCIELRSGDTLAVLDCGTGARALGGSLMTRWPTQRAHIFLTHFHWDHIQGFPFFVPVLVPGWNVHVYGAGGLEQGLHEAMSGQMQYTYFPLRMADLQAELHFHELGEQTFQAERLTVSTQFLNHTCPALGYLLSAGGVRVAYMTDHEPYWPHNPAASLAEALVHPGDQRHYQFFKGVDLLIHDAQYLSEEYPAKRGWGHSTVEYVVDVAVAAGVKRLALFHHDPPRDDAKIPLVLERALQQARRRGAEHSLEIFVAAEGMEIDIPEEHEQEQQRAAAPLVAAPHLLARIALVGERERRRLLREALADEGLRFIESGADGRDADWLAGNPDLLLVAPPHSGLAIDLIQRATRAAGSRPVIAVLDTDVGEDILKGVADAATDVVLVPFGPPNLRARVRAALSREGPRDSDVSSPESNGVPAGEAFQLMDRLTSDELKTMLAGGSRYAFHPGERIFAQGDPPAGVYYIQRGLVRLLVEAVDGTSVTVGFAGPGDTVGEMSALDGCPRSAAAIAVESVEASYIPRDVFRATLERAPRTSFRLLRMLARRLRDVDLRLARGTTHSVVPLPVPSDDESTTMRRRLGHLETLLEQLEVTEEQLDHYAHDVRAAYLRVRGWRQAVQALRTVTHLLSTTHSARSLYRQTLRTLVRLVPSESTGLYTIEADRVTRLAAQGQDPAASWSMAEAPEIVRETIRGGSLQSAPPLTEHADAGAGLSTWTAVVPIQAGVDNPGFLWLQRSWPYTEDDLALAEIVATACAVAIREQTSSARVESARASGLADLDSTLRAELDRARRLRYPVGLVVSDLSAEHLNGSSDGTAAHLMEALRVALRRTDVLALGPLNTLAVILPGVEPGSLSAVESKVQAAVLDAINGAARNGLRLGSGVAFPEDGHAAQLLQQAERALHAAV